MAAQPGQAELLAETQKYAFDSILDIGFGHGEAAQFFVEHGKHVTVTGYDVAGYDVDPKLLEQIEVFENVPAENMDCFEDETFDAVWCSHVLEHSRNAGLLLDEIYRVIKPGGMLFILVPPYCIPVSGGHLNVGWHIGNMIYNLIFAGFDTANGSYVRHKHNIVAFVPKPHTPIPLPKDIRYDIGDIELLKDRFPMRSYQNFQGDIMNHNWEWKYYTPSLNDRKKILWHYTKWHIRAFLMKHIF